MFSPMSCCANPNSNVQPVKCCQYLIEVEVLKQRPICVPRQLFLSTVLENSLNKVTETCYTVVLLVFPFL